MGSERDDAPLSTLSQRLSPLLEGVEALLARVRAETRALRERPCAALPARESADAIRATRAAVEAEIDRLEDEVVRLSRRADLTVCNADEWRRRAMLSVKAKDDALAREALARAKECDGSAIEIRAEHDHAARVMNELRAALAALAGDAGGLAERSVSAIAAPL